MGTYSVASDKKAVKAADVALIASSKLFDAVWYVSRYKPDRSKTPDPARHYLLIGGSRGFSASPRFISAAYLALYPDVARAQRNPLLHYLKRGMAEGRQAVARADLAGLGLENMGRQEQQSVAVVAASPLFDEEFYLARNPNVVESGLHPMLHYVRNGWEFALDPGPDFDAAAYVAEHPEIIQNRLAPLVHYERFGRPNATPVPAATGEAAGRAAPTAKPRSASLKQPSASAAPGEPTKAARRPGSASVSEPAAPAKAKQPFELDEEDAVALIAKTQFFDPTWYLKRNPDVSRTGIDPVLHYVRAGAGERRRPSVYFDADYYYEQAPELAEAHVNPLVHFLTIGRGQGKFPTPLLEAASPPGLRKPGELGDPIIPAPAGEPDPRSVRWTRHAELSDSAGLMFGVVCLGLLEEPTELSPLSAYCRIMGLDEADMVKTGLEQDAFGSSRTISAETYRGFGPRFASGADRLADAWFADERTLRLRFGDETRSADADAERLVVRGLQGSTAEPADLAACGEALLPASGTGFVDLKLADPMLPVVIVLASPGGTVLEVSLIPFPSLARGGAHYAELIATAVRPSPIDDLRRYSDALVLEIAAGPSAAIRQIIVRRRDATGAERIFSRSVVDWAAKIFGVSIALEATDEADSIQEHLHSSLTTSLDPSIDLAGHAGGQFSLAIPADAVPTIAALAARGLAMPDGATAVTGPFLVAEATSGDPRLAVTLPPMGPDLLALQSRTAMIGFPVLHSAEADEGPRRDWQTPVGRYLAIRRRRFTTAHEAVMTTPLAPDVGDIVLRPPSSGGQTGKITALIVCREPRAALRLIESLVVQTEAARLSLRVRYAPHSANDFKDFDEHASRLFPDRSDVAAAAGGLRAEIAAATADGADPYLLIASEAVVAHDPRTLSSLIAMIEAPNVASAGCVVVRENANRKTGATEFESGGYFPSHVSFIASPRLVVSAPNCLDALPDATYPVIANQFDFTLVRRDATAALNERWAFAGTRADLVFGLRACAAGFRHLCTSAVRVVSVAEPPPKESLDPVADLDIRPGQWEDILSRVTLLRELRS